MNKVKKYFFNWQVLFAISFILLSVLLYYSHYLIFHDPHHIFIYAIGDVAFIPMEVLLVTLVLHKLLEYRAKKEMLNKMNMVIGAFYSEVGNDLLGHMYLMDQCKEELTKKLSLTNEWTLKIFRHTKIEVKKIKLCLDFTEKNILDLRECLVSKRDFLLRLLENPNLLEHDSFTDLLWSVFHLTEELLHRKRNKDFSEKDKEHLARDAQRAYVLLVREWLDYMQHLQKDYPYLFSLSVRTNPFNPQAKAEFA